jgi:hypothetical protein
MDDAPTVCAISILAVMLSTMLHEGLGHAAIAITTLHATGLLTSLAWSSEQVDRLVLAGGTLVNLVSALVFWLLLRVVHARPTLRFFLLLSMAFNLMTSTGYFLFSGVIDFGDWASFIAGLHPYWLWRVGLVVVGALSYYGTIRLVGGSLIRQMGVSWHDAPRFRRLTWLPYFSAIAIDGVAGLFNPFGLKYVFLSALAATAGGLSGMMWMHDHIPKETPPGPAQIIPRSYAWIGVAAVLGLIFIVVFGPGVHLPR